LDSRRLSYGGTKMIHYIAPEVEIIAFTPRERLATYEDTNNNDEINLGNQPPLSMEETVEPWL